MTKWKWKLVKKLKKKTAQEYPTKQKIKIKKQTYKLYLCVCMYL